jgi:hypothetical protein
MLQQGALLAGDVNLGVKQTAGRDQGSVVEAVTRTV